MIDFFMKITRLTIICLASSVLVACSMTPNIDDRRVINNADSFESTNRKIYSFNDSLDNNLMKPVASGYKLITPEPVRIRLTNFFNNANYLNVILNFSLQGKVDQSLSDIFRFIFNSTLGIGGLFDVATPMGLVAHKEDLGQTLAVWGLSQGPYLNIPAFGPNTLRNTPDFISAYFLSPLTYVTSVVALPVMALNLINTRANLLDASDFRDSAAIDPYSFTREAYLQSRRNQIYDGNPPSESFDDIFELELENSQ
jgi:phospholipid-binding lipoprotein MlaA